MSDIIKYIGSYDGIHYQTTVLFTTLAENRRFQELISGKTLEELEAKLREGK